MILKLFVKFSYGNWFAAVISFFTTPIISLLIIPEEFGKASMFTLAVNFLLQFCLLGIDQSFMRTYYEKNENERAKLALFCSFFTIGVFGVLTFFLLLFANAITYFLFSIENNSCLYLLIICLFLSIVERFTTMIVRMKQKGNIFSIIKIISSIIGTIVTIGYAQYISPTFEAIIFSTLSGLLIAIFISVWVEKYFWSTAKLLPFISVSDIKSMLRYGLPLVPVFIISLLFQGMDRIALRCWSDFNEIGIYAAADKIVSVLAMIQSGFCLFWTPLALEKYEKNHYDYSFFEKVFKYMSILMFLVVLGLILFGKYILMIFANTYQTAMYVIPFLSLMPFFYILSDVTGMGIGFKKQTYWSLIVLLVTTGLNFIGNYILVPSIGARGAALSTGIAYLCFFSLRTWFSARLFPAKYDIKVFIIYVMILLFASLLNTFVCIDWWISGGVYILVLLCCMKKIKEICNWGIENLNLTKKNI